MYDNSIIIYIKKKMSLNICDHGKLDDKKNKIKSVLSDETKNLWCINRVFLLLKSLKHFVLFLRNPCVGF